MVTRNGQLISSYTYDSNSNRQTRTSSTGMASYTYDAQDRLTTWSLAPDTWNLTYTANGELQSKSNGTETTTYQYDVLGNLRHVTLPDGTNIDYVIDGQNHRVGKKVNGALVQGWLYGNQPNPLAELDGNKNVVSIFVYGSRANVPDYMVKGGVTYRILTDHLGSPRLIIDASTGTVLQRLDYDEFGNILQDTNVLYNGQPIAVVVARSLPEAEAAAKLLRIEYKEQPAKLDFNALLKDARPPKRGSGASHRGDPAASLAKAAGDIGTTIFHPVGTAKMGAPNDPMAVVDERLRFYGLSSLRIVDASIMPTITSGNTNTPTAMIAEKGATMISADGR